MAWLFGGNNKLLEYKSPKWRFLHNVSKPFIEAAVTAIYKECEDIIKGKMEKGWQNPEIKLLYENWGEVIEKDKNVFKSEQEYDHIRDFMSKLRAIVCCQLDEDSHFTLRFFYFLEVLFRDQEKYRIEWHKNRAYWDWEKIKRDLTEHDPRWADSRKSTEKSTSKEKSSITEAGDTSS